MLVENINIEMASAATIGFSIILFFVLTVTKIRENRKYKPYPGQNMAYSNARKQHIHDDDDDEVTEIINTMDYHQIPKELISKKAKRLAEGKI